MGSRSTFLGTTFMTAASALRVAVQILILPIIGRILGPHAYGQIALVSPFIMFSIVLSESGLGASIVRAQEVTKELEGTVFCFSSAFSLAIIALFAIFAYPLGHILNEPDFPPLLIAMSTILLLAAFNIVPAALLLRNKQYKLIALSDVISTFGGIATVITGILLDWGVWSLVAQQITLWLWKVVVVSVGSSWRPHFVFVWRHIRENIKFSANLTASTLLYFIARNIDNVLIGAFMGPEILGYYALAFQIVGLPSMVLSGSIYTTMFSNTSEASRTGHLPLGQYLKILRGLFLISTPALVGLAATAPLSIPLLLGDKWEPAIMILILLMPLGLFQSLGAVNSGMIIGMGRSDIPFKLGLISSTATILAICAGVFISSTAVAIGVSLTAFFGYSLTIRALTKECQIPVGKIIEAGRAPVISAILMAIAVTLVEQVMPEQWSLLLRLVLSIITGVTAYALALIILFHDHLATDVAEIKAVLFKQQQKKI